MPELTLALLGGFAVQIGTGTAPGFRSQKARALLAYLVMEGGRPHERAALAALFWPEMPDALALRNLSQTLIWLRQAIGDGDPSYLLLTRRQVQWNPAATANVDAVRFLALVERRGVTAGDNHAALREAVDLYRGEFLAGFSLAGCPAFDEWLLLQREYFHRLALDALFRLTGEALAAGDHAAAATFARRQLALDRWREEAVRQLLQALAALGRRSEALAEYENARRLLAQELDIAPQAETIALAEDIRRGMGESRPQTTDGRPQSGDDALPPHNLPARLTSLLGREEELATLSGWLAEPETRLVTISGIGGAGKTRLALAVASAFAAQPPSATPHPFPDGVWFVPLAGLRDEPANPSGLDLSESFVTAVATTLGLALIGPESPTRQLARGLREQHLLLVLDNYEHLMATRPVLLDLLHSVPGVRVLVTSRERLGVGGERVLALDGLPLPPPEAAAGNDALLAHSSARLFFTRALERGVQLALDDGERQSIVRICRLAEGLPLVIELAATWTGHFTCAEIATAMAANLDFLSAESAAARSDLPARQRSPRAAFDYAWRLLSADEQRVLAQLALLHDPFPREAALVVSEARLIDLISLLNKSLLRQTSPGWYALHSLVRQFALEELPAMAGLEAAARERHAGYFLGLVTNLELLWYGATPQQAQAGIRPLYQNVRSALQWAVEHDAWTVLNEALFSLVAYLRAEGLISEAIETMRQLAARLQPAEADGQIQARLLTKSLVYEAALRLRRDSDVNLALELTQQAMSWAQIANDPLTQMFVAMIRGTVLFVGASFGLLPPGEHDRVRQRLEQALAYGREVPASSDVDRRRLAALTLNTLNTLGNYHAVRGERATARRCYDEALVICRATAFVTGEGQICNSLAELLENEGALEPALRYREQGLRAFQHINEPDSVSSTQDLLCGVLTYLGDYHGALGHGRAALELRQRNGILGHLLYYRLALAEFHLGHNTEALQLIAAAREETPQSAHRYQFPLLAGECYTRRGEWAQAVEALQAALPLAQRSGNPLAVAVVRRAQADLALAQGDTAAALGHVEPLLPLLAVSPLPSSAEPLRLFWTCYGVLRANDDGRAPGVLAAAEALLQSQAAAIHDDARRTTFLHAVAANRAIAAAAVPPPLTSL